MDILITFICNLVVLAIGAFYFLASGVGGGIMSSGKSGAGTFVAIVVLLVCLGGSYAHLGGTGILVTLVAAVFLVAFIVIKPIARLRSIFNKKDK